MVKFQLWRGKGGSRALSGILLMCGWQYLEYHSFMSLLFCWDTCCFEHPGPVVGERLPLGWTAGSLLWEGYILSTVFPDMTCFPSCRAELECLSCTDSQKKALMTVKHVMGDNWVVWGCLTSDERPDNLNREKNRGLAACMSLSQPIADVS